MPKVRKVQDGDEAILKEARARFKEAVDADSHNRIDALDDLKFAWNYGANDKDPGYQWTDAAKKARKGRPMMTENRLPQFVRQIVNSQRQNRPAINVAPASGDASVQVANVIEGMVRHIEQWSKADLAYDNAFEAAVTCGAGYFRVLTEYAGEDGFDQEICIKAIDNSFSVYDDQSFSEPDACDRRYSFVTERVSRKDFEAKYGFEPSSVSGAGIGDDASLWFGDDDVQVAEYWRVRTETDTIQEEEPEGDKPRSREVERKIVEQFLMTGDRIIKESEWLGTYIPIIPVFGEVRNIEGKKYRKSLIRDAKELQRMVNYFASATIETTALQPKVPFIGPVGAFDTERNKWDTSNDANHAYIGYDGEVPPQRQPPPAFPAAMREIHMGAIEALKAVMGIYDASLGARSNETSGIAIERRQVQGDNATYHFIDNMVRAIRYAGLVIIDLLPKIYNGQRVVRILAPDGAPQMAAINQVFVDRQSMQPVEYNVTKGRYDVVVKAGPSFQSQREETRVALTEIIKAYPPSATVLGPTLVKHMDFPESDKVAAQLAQTGQSQGIPPQLQQQMQKMGKQLQDLTHQTQQQELKLQAAELEKS